MKHIYDFGISQDDPQLEIKALPLEGNLLCIASGGDVPLSLLAWRNIRIRAIDSSLNQIRLCRLKLKSILYLEPNEAAEFLGFSRTTPEKRLSFFNEIDKYLIKEDSVFWREHLKVIENGVIKAARFERYLRFFCSLVVPILGKKNIQEFVQMENVDEQKEFFDKKLDKSLMKWIFRIVFSPVLYKKRGLDAQGLLHQRKNMADEFYLKFRDFFTLTPANRNLYLQFYMLGEVIQEEAMPAYLKPKFYQSIRDRSENIEFVRESVQNELETSKTLSFRNYSLSNISDWLDEEEMNYILKQISDKSIINSSILLRYIHKNPMNSITQEYFGYLDGDFGFKNKGIDRFPFYSLVNLKIS